MNLFLGHPALGKLLRLKLRGTLRKQGRRLRTPSGLILTLIGVLIFLFWFGSLFLHWFIDRGEPPVAEELRPLVRVGALMITTLAVSSALTHRGLYLPREEIERLFSAPVKRRDLVRYRLLASLGRGAFGGIVLGVVTMRHMPMPVPAFLAVFVALETLPVIGQACAILAGSLEKSLVTRLRWVRTFAVVAVLAFGAAFFYQWLAGDDEVPWAGSLRGVPTELDLDAVAAHPVLVVVTAPFDVWARAITAPTLGAFLPWFGASLLIWFLLYQLTARLPFDYRELSLETSANVAERIRRMRRGGGGASAGRVSRRSVGWRIPWLFGRGPFGALAWRKTGAIVRKARGTLFVSALVLAFVTLLSTLFGDTHDDAARILAPAAVGVLGLFYLAAGLRFDFRDELDRMESIKAWPLSPARIFLAMLLPEVVLVSLLLMGAVLLRGVIAGGIEPAVYAIAAMLPLFVFAWVAVDNAVFLLMPVRHVPGQEGALQNAGRGIVLLLVRLTFLTSIGGASVGVGLALGFGLVELGYPESLAWAAAFGATWVLVLLCDAVLVWFGGRMFRRFDVARDRG